MLGGGALLTVMAVVSVLERRHWWSYPNLLGAHFYGPRVIASGFGWPTVSGIAFQLLIASCAGALFGALFGVANGGGRLIVLGAFWGLLLFYGSEQFYKITSPFVAAYLPHNAVLVAHLAYGSCLAGIGRMGAGRDRAGTPPALERRVPQIRCEHTSAKPALHEDADSTGQESTL